MSAADEMSMYAYINAIDAGLLTAGQTYEIKLPTYIKSSGRGLPFTVKADDGTVIGILSSSGGKMLFTVDSKLNDEIASGGQILDADIWFDASLDMDMIAGRQEIKIPLIGLQGDIVITVVDK